MIDTYGYLQDVFVAALSATQAHPVALGIAIVVVVVTVTYVAARCTVLWYRFVTRGEPPPRKIYVCHTVTPGAADAMKAWAAKLS